MKRKTRVFLIGLYLLNLSIVNLSKGESDFHLIGSIAGIVMSLLIVSTTLFKRSV